MIKLDFVPWNCPTTGMKSWKFPHVFQNILHLIKFFWPCKLPNKISCQIRRNKFRSQSGLYCRKNKSAHSMQDNLLPIVLHKPCKCWPLEMEMTCLCWLMASAVTMSRTKMVMTMRKRSQIQWFPWMNLTQQWEETLKIDREKLHMLEQIQELENKGHIIWENHCLHQSDEDLEKCAN